MHACRASSFMKRGEAVASGNILVMIPVSAYLPPLLLFLFPIYGLEKEEGRKEENAEA